MKKVLISPLRYPGSKRRLAVYIEEALRLNSLRPKLLVEPFAGGASVALQLLHNGVVEKAVLGEKDPLVASFWKIVFYDSDWFIQEIERLVVTLENWSYFKNTQFSTDRERALACIFLNRTSFSGILAPTAGPIGGYTQESQYKLDCRFTVPTITERIRQAAALKEKIISVEASSWQSTMAKVDNLKYKDNEVLYYMDPPFYSKAKRLYTFSFEEKDHTELHDFLVEIRQPWILSYDPAMPIIRMYSENGCDPKRINILYSISSTNPQVKAQEVVITNLPQLPEETRLWRSR